jgi:hypothetical protein
MFQLARWCYALLLRCYPPDFREQFGLEMQQVFAQVLNDAARRGPVALLTVGVRELSSVLVGGLIARGFALWLLIALAGAVVIVVGLTVVTTIAVLTSLGGRWGPDPGTALRLTTSLLKFATFIAMVWLTGRAYLVIAGQRRAALKAFVIWSLVGSVCVVGLALTRDYWSTLLSGASVKLYPNGVLPAYDLHNPGIAAHYARWQAANALGLVMLSEIGMIIVLAALHAAIGWRWGSRPVWAVPAGVAASLVAGILYQIILPWNRLDYDLFLGSTVPGIVWADAFLYPLGEAYPLTALAAFFYLSAMASACLIILSGQRQPAAPYVTG